ncbi:MAG: type II toxin-antitoxin system VapB family antitoxin [Actinomycetota bacterium]
MGRVEVEVDDELCATVMRRFGLDAMEEAVELALRRLAPDPLSGRAARRLRGSGWDGDLDQLRSGAPRLSLQGGLISDPRAAG